MSNTIKGAFVVALGLGLFITLLSLLIPSKIVTVKAIPIHVDEKKIIGQISNLNNWQNWHPAFRENSSKMSITNSGHSASWNGSVIEITGYDSVQIKFLLKQTGSNDVENQIDLLPLSETKTGRQVQWTSVIKLPWYPWEKFRGLLIEKMIGQGYEEALTGLRNYLEK